jgi:hypothetical protein
MGAAECTAISKLDHARARPRVGRSYRTISSLQKIDGLESTRPTDTRTDRTRWTTLVLKPVVVRAVDLHELAVAIATVTRLLDALPTLCTGLPDAVCDHPFAERLDRHPKAVHLEEFLVCQRRAEIRISRPDDAQGLLTQPLRQDVIAPLSS